MLETPSFQRFQIPVYPARENAREPYTGHIDSGQIATLSDKIHAQAPRSATRRTLIFLGVLEEQPNFELVLADSHKNHLGSYVDRAKSQFEKTGVHDEESRN